MIFLFVLMSHFAFSDSIKIERDAYGFIETASLTYSSNAKDVTLYTNHNAFNLKSLEVGTFRLENSSLSLNLRSLLKIRSGKKQSPGYKSPHGYRVFLDDKELAASDLRYSKIIEFFERKVPTEKWQGVDIHQLKYGFNGGEVTHNVYENGKLLKSKNLGQATCSPIMDRKLCRSGDFGFYLK